MAAFFKTFAQKETFRLMLLAAMSFAVMSPVLFKGIPYGYDLPHHYQCALTFVESIRAGDFYPAWSLNRNFGYGGMETRLYPPVSHYALALSYLAAGDWHLASWFVFFFFTFLGSLGVYLWAREYVSAGQAAFAGCVYALLPYHLNQIYNTFFFAEFVGSSVLPFALVFVSRVCRRGKAADVLGLAISFAALILTHLPLTVIGSISFVVYGLSLLRRERAFSQIFKLAAGALLGLAASAFFWTKVIEERDLMAKTLIYADPWLDYRFHFLLTPIQTFDSELQSRIYENATFFYDLMFLCPVVLTIAFAAPLMAENKKRLRRMRGVWAIFALAVFLAVPFSRFAWDVLPILQEVQFPWRWLAVVSVAAPVLAAGGLDNALLWFSTKKRPFALIICGCLLGVVTFSLSQIVRQAPHIAHAEIEPMMAENAEKEGFTFWWTIWTRREVFELKEKVSASKREVNVQNWTPRVREFAIGAGDSAVARVAVFYHPNWQATVNGALTKTAPDEYGALKIPLTPQTSKIILNFVETPLVTAAQWVSRAAWLCFAAFVLLRGRKRFFAAQKIVVPPKNKQNLWRILDEIHGLSNSRYAIFLPLAASLIAILPAILFGIHEGGDLEAHVQFASTFREAILSGDFYPSWNGGENLGYGSVGLRVYPPLTAFVLALLHILIADWHLAVSVFFLSAGTIGGYGAYLWAKEFAPARKAIWAGVLFVLMPYHLFEIYNASMYAEFAGVSIIPFCFLFVTRICRGGKWTDVLGLAVSFAFLILAHLPLFVIGSASFFVYALSALRREKLWKSLFQLTVGAVAGLAASSIYWARMISEKDWMRNAKFWGDRHFEYDANFLLALPEINHIQIWYFNLILFSVLMLCGGAAASLILKNGSGSGRRYRPLFVLFFGSVFMSTVLSAPLWALLPYLHEVQFPWRWLTVISASGCIIAALGAETIKEFALTSPFRLKAVKGFCAAVLLLFLGIYGLIWVDYRLNAIPARSFERWVSEKSNTLGFEWFWTVKTKPEAFSILEKATVNGREAAIISWESEEKVFSVKSGDANTARVAALYYPHWRAVVNDEPVEIEMASDGTILIPLPTESATVRIWFQEPNIVRYAFYISLFSWLMLTALFFVAFLKSKRLNLFAGDNAKSTFSE